MRCLLARMHCARSWLNTRLFVFFSRFLFLLEIGRSCFSGFLIFSTQISFRLLIHERRDLMWNWLGRIHTSEWKRANLFVVPYLYWARLIDVMVFCVCVVVAERVLISLNLCCEASGIALNSSKFRTANYSFIICLLLWLNERENKWKGHTRVLIETSR